MSYERQGCTKDGRKFWFSVNANHVRDNGRHKYSIINFTDITDRKSNEDALKESEAFNSGVLKGSPSPIMVVNSDRSIRYVNPALEQITGYSASELIGLKPPYPWWDSSTFQKDDVRTFSTEHLYPMTRELKFLNKKGGFFWTATQLSEILENGQTKYILSIWTDITQRKKAEEALKESEAFNAGLLNDSPNPIIVTNRDRSIRYVNPALVKITGYSSSELLGVKPPFPWWHAQSYSESEHQAFQEDHIVNKLREVNFRRKDGTFFWVFMQLSEIVEQGAIKYIISNWMDITKRREMEAALRESEAFNRTLLDDAPNPVLVANADSSIQYTNAAFEKLTGFSSTEIIGVKPPYPWWPKTTVRGKSFAATSIAREDTTLLESQFKKKGGELFWVGLSRRSILENGEVKYYLANWVDITETKKAQEALESELIRRRILIDQSSDGIVVLDSNGGVYEANQRFAEMLGYSPEEIKNIHVWDWDLNWSPEQLKQSISTDNLRGRHLKSQHRRKDGTRYHVEISTNSADFGKQRLIFCVCRDITRQVISETALRESEAFNNSLLFNAPNPIIVTFPDGAVRYYNPAVEHLTGFSQDEIMGARVPFPWWPAEKVDEYITQDAKSISQDTVTHERRMRRKDGGTIWIIETINLTKETGKIKYFLSNWIDITERKKWEEALTESEAFNASLLNDAPNPVLVYNMDESIKYVNPAMELLTGYTSQDLVGLKPPYPWWETLKIETFNVSKQQHRDEGFDQLEQQIRKKNGDLVWVSTSMRLVKEQGKTRYYLANWLEITERKAMEERIIDLYQKEKAHREELQEEARLRGLFINVLAHELRTPITPILASTGMLNDLFENQDEDIRKRLVTNIYGSTRTLARRLEELLDLARYSRGTFKLIMQATDLYSFFKETLGNFSPTIQQRHQELITNIPENLPRVEIDPSRLEQVIINLLSNSSKFSPENGRIMFNVAITHNQLLVEVRDEGIGIGPEEQNRLFQPYHRVEQDRQQFTGLGLGLAVAKQIVEAHKGKIWVESDLGKGSSFIFSIPLKLA